MDLDRRLAATPPIAPEAALLIACGAACSAGSGGDRIAGLINNPIDWSSLLRMAAGHGMSAMASYALAPYAPVIPAAVIAQLRQRHLAIAARNLYLANELLAVVDLLAAGGVATLAFKGPTLAAIAYREPGLREYSDLDILVQPGTAAEARRVLIAHGYRPECADARAVASRIFRCYEEPFTAADGVAMLDLHWRVLPDYAGFPDCDELWARARTVDLRGRTVCTLGTEDLLLFLCVHGAKHGWPLLGWICDLAGIIDRSQAIDWDALIARADATRNRPSLMLGMSLAHHLMGTPMPPAIAAQIADDAVLSRRTTRTIQAMLRNFGERRGLAQELIIPLDSIAAPAQKLRYLAIRALRPTLDDWIAMPLPAPLFPLYYATRPVRLALSQMRKLIAGARPPG